MGRKSPLVGRLDTSIVTVAFGLELLTDGFLLSLWGSVSLTIK